MINFRVPVFLKNVLTLSFGVIISQIMGVALLPVLSRLYNPEMYGLYATLIGVSQICILLSTLKYDKALVISSKQDQASLFIFTILVVFIIASIVTMIIVIAYLMNIEFNLAYPYIFMIPFAVIGYGLLSVVLNFNQGNEKFKVISIINVVQTSTNLLMSIILGSIKFKLNGLVIGWVFAPLIVALSYLIINRHTIIKMMQHASILEAKLICKKYINFPKYYVWYDLLFTALPFVLPVVLLHLFGAKDSGYFSMAYRILMVPFIVISGAISNVFVISANKLFLEHNNFSNVYVKVFKKILLIGSILYLFFYMFGSKLLIYILGNQWNGMDQYIKILSVWMFFEFIAVVFKSNTYIIVHKQYIGLLIQVMNSLIGVLSFMIFYPYGILYSLIIFSVIMSIFCVINLLVTYKLSFG